MPFRKLFSGNGYEDAGERGQHRTRSLSCSLVAQCLIKTGVIFAKARYLVGQPLSLSRHVIELTSQF